MTGRSYVTDISPADMPARAPSMLLDTIRVGSNTYMGVSRACDEAMAAPSSVPRALLDPFLRGVAFLATEGLDALMGNKANQQYHFMECSSRAGVCHVLTATGVCRYGANPRPAWEHHTHLLCLSWGGLRGTRHKFGCLLVPVD